MTAHDVRLTRAAQLVAAPQQPARHPLTGLSTERLARRLVVYNPAWDEVPPLLMRARREIAQLTTADVVHRVISHNPDSFWAIARRGEYGTQRRSAEGFFAFLLLNEEGAERLIDGTLDTGDPDPALLAAQSEKPAAIYLWAGHARGALTGAIPLVFGKLSTPQYRDVDAYSRAVSADGQRILEAIGFQRGATFRNKSAPQR